MKKLSLYLLAISSILVGANLLAMDADDGDRIVIIHISSGFLAQKISGSTVIGLGMVHPNFDGALQDALPEIVKNNLSVEWRDFEITPAEEIIDGLKERGLYRGILDKIQNNND